jgi:hypothetical protein
MQKMNDLYFRASSWTYFFIACSALAGCLLAFLPVILVKMSVDFFWLSIPVGGGWLLYSLFELQKLRNYYVRFHEKQIEIGGSGGIRSVRADDIRSVGIYVGMIFIVLYSGEVVNLPILYRKHIGLFMHLKGLQQSNQRRHIQD